MFKAIKVFLMIVGLIIIIIIGWLVVDYLIYGSWYFSSFDSDYYDDYDDEHYDDEEYDDDSNLIDDAGDDVEIPKHTNVNTLNQLIVLINFKNQKLATDESDWEDFYFSSGNSVTEYFDEMSKGGFRLVAANETYGKNNDGVITVSIDRKHPNLSAESSDKEYDVCTDIFIDMLAEVDEYIDFSQYDANGNGYIEAMELSITMVAAGYEENEYTSGENQVAAICISEDKYTDVDGVGVSDYIFCGELDISKNQKSEIVTIGTVCHETAHVLGLPDLYDTDYSSIGLGFHSLMSEGNYNKNSGERLGETPAPLVAWSRIFVGFAKADIVSSDGEYTLYGQSTDEYNIIRIDEGNGYYLIENVDFNEYGAGIEEYMDHSGIAIWYIDEKVMTEENIYNNEVNDNDRNRGVDLMEAADNRDLYEEALDYDNPDYEHYFAKGYIDTFTTKGGTVIRILDEPYEKMRVDIDFD